MNIPSTVPANFSVVDVDLEVQSFNVPDAELDLNYFDGVTTETKSGEIVSFDNPMTLPLPFVSVKADITAQQSGSGDPSPTNVRPITGFAGANVVNNGINQWDEEWEVGGISSTGNNANINGALRSKNHIPVSEETTYYFLSPLTATSSIRICFYNRTKTFTSTILLKGKGAFSVPRGSAYMRFGTAETYGNTYNHDISINYPSTDHDYHAYNGSSHTIPFGSTVYGGTLNVTTGVLTVTHAEVDLGSLTYVRNTQYANPLFFSTIDNAKFISGSVVSNVICSIFKTVSSSVQNNVGVDNVVSCSHYFNSTYNLFITCSTYADASTFKTAMDGVQLVYELATPTEVQLTPTEVKTLLGQNNIWADTGEVEVTYYTRG